MYKEIRSLADQLQEELHRLTEGPTETTADPAYLVNAAALFGIELLAILLANVGAAALLSNRQNRLNQSLLWLTSSTLPKLEPTDFW